MSHSKSIYLAGPITNLSYGEARHGWREEFRRILHDVLQDTTIELFSPMRGKDHLEGLESLSGSEWEYTHAMSSQSGIITRDKNDVRGCGVMVANLLGAQERSIGTIMEFAWADAFGTPIILVIEADGNNVHEHMMLTGVAGYRVQTLEEAAVLARWLVTPGI